MAVFIYNTTKNGDYTEVYPDGLYKYFDKQKRLHNLKYSAQYSLDSEELFVKGSEVYAIHGIIFDTREEWQEQVSESHAAGQYDSESYPVKKYIDYNDKTKGYMIYKPNTDVYEYYNQYGQLHNTEGPAILSSKPSEDQFYLNGVEVEYYTWLSFCDLNVIDEKEINDQFPPAPKRKIYVKKPVPSNSNPSMCKNPSNTLGSILNMGLPKTTQAELEVAINTTIQKALDNPGSSISYFIGAERISKLLKQASMQESEILTAFCFIAEFVDAEIKKRSDPSYQKVKAALELLDKDMSKVINFTYLKNQYPDLFEQFADKAQ